MRVRGGIRRRTFAGALIAGLVALGVAVGSASAADSNASCNGVLVSSLAGQPGVVAGLTREFHQEFKDAGLPPGFFDVGSAQEHAGSVEACGG
jgi:hypothetical protein